MTTSHKEEITFAKRVCTKPGAGRGQPLFPKSLGAKVHSCHVTERRRREVEWGERCIYTSWPVCVNNSLELHYAVSYIGSHTLWWVILGPRCPEVLGLRGCVRTEGKIMVHSVSLGLMVVFPDNKLSWMFYFLFWTAGNLHQTFNHRDSVELYQTLSTVSTNLMNLTTSVPNTWRGPRRTAALE